MAWIPAEDDENSVENAGNEFTDQNRIIQLLKMIRSQPEGRQLIRDVKQRGSQMATPVGETPETLGNDINARMRGLPDPTRMRIPNIPAQPPQTPKSLGREMMQQNPFLNMMGKEAPMRDLMVDVPPLRNEEQADRPHGMMRARTRPDIESQIRSEADGLMADEAQANAWHPPKVMPNTPRDPDKELREMAAMKAFLANGGGPSYGRKPQGPMSSIHPSQNPFSEQTASPEEQASVAGRMMASQIPQTQPVQNVQGGMPSPTIPPPEGFPNRMQEGVRSDNPMPMGQGMASNPGQSAEQGQPNPLRDKLMGMLEAEQSPDGMMEMRSRRNGLDDRMNAISSQNADLGFMKLLMQNANQMGQIGGKVASSAPFDGMVDGIQKRNAQAEERYIKSDDKFKAQKDDRMKSMLALLRMDQDAALRREGFDVQRDNNTEMRNYRNDMIDATRGRDANTLALGERRLANTETLGERGLQLQEKNINSQIEDRTERRRIDEANKLQAAKDRAAKAKVSRVKANKLTATAQKNKMFATRADSADKAYDRFLKSTKYDPTGYKDKALGKVPLVGNSLTSKEYQMQRQLESEFTRAILRDESGAVIGGGEQTDEERKYFPQPGDSEDVVKRKATARRLAIKTLQDSYEQEAAEAEALAAEYGQDDGTGLSGEKVKVMWKGKVKLIDAEKLGAAISAGAKEVP